MGSDDSPTLDASLIQRDLSTRRVGRNVICFGTLDSTNDTAAEAARQPGSDGLVVAADVQRKGRGRHGRVWRSEAGANVLMSVVLKDPDRRLEIEGVTVATGLAVAEAIDEIGSGRAAVGPAVRPAVRLKWPNDVLVDGRKVAGVLVEHRTVASERTLLLGVGVNVNSHPADEAVDRPATSLAACYGGPIDRVAVIRALLIRLDEWVRRLADDPQAAAGRLRSEWSKRCGMLNQRHTISDRGRRFTGRVVDIDPLEGLVLLTDNGTQIRIPAQGASVE